MEQIFLRAKIIMTQKMEGKGRKGCGWRGSGRVEVAIMKWRNEASKARQSGRTVSQTDRQPATSSSAPALFFPPAAARCLPASRPGPDPGPSCIPACLLPPLPSFRSASLPPPRFSPSLPPSPACARRSQLRLSCFSSPLLRLLALSSSPPARACPQILAARPRWIFVRTDPALDCKSGSGGRKLELGLSRISGAVEERIVELQHFLRDRTFSATRAATAPHTSSGIARQGIMTQVERAGSLGHAELDRWLAKDAANCCLLEFSDTDAFLQASIPSIWDPISAHGEDVMSYFTDANVFADSNAGEISAVLGNADEHVNHQLYDHSCSDSEVDDSDTVSSNPDDLVDLAASFLVESDASGAPVEDGKQENASEFPVERPRNRRKRELTLEGAQEDTPVRVVRAFKRQRMVGPIINIYDDALHSSSCTHYFSADTPVEAVNNTTNNEEGELYATQWNHDNFLTPSYSGIDGFCNNEEVESSRTDATEKEPFMPSQVSPPVSTAKVELSEEQPTVEHSSYLRVC